MKKCYSSPIDNSLTIIHFIITRFMIEYWPLDNFTNIIYTNEYILNGIRVMKKYLFPSLSNQSCKNFIWILKLGDKVNITYIKSLIELNNSFESVVIYEKNIKQYIRRKSSGFDVLITSRIDYDDRIYYDAVNDIRKAININKPIQLYGYSSGVCYYEWNKKYYGFDYSYNNQGVMSIFVSLIVILKKVNDAYNIFDLGSHTKVRENLLNSYKSFGLTKLNYEPAIFDSGTEKFVWVRHKYSGLYKYSANIEKNLIEYRFDLRKFYGK